MQALIRYWTGTGNTARAAGLVAQTLAGEGWTVDCAEVRRDSPVPLPGDLAAFDLVVLACPTLGFGAPAHFLSWLGRWPRGGRGRAAVLAVGGSSSGPQGPAPGFTGLVPWQLSRRLRRAGLETTAADVFYPENWTQFFEPPDAAVCRGLRADADPRVLKFARRLVEPGAGAPVRLTAGRAAVGLVAVLFRWFGRRVLGKLFAADANCTGCGLCVRGCPAGAIRLQGNRPRWNFSCDACNRCINRCPTDAIQVSLARLLVLGVGNLGLLVGALFLVPAVGWPGAAAVFAAGTVLQVTLLDGLLFRLEGRPGPGAWLTWGWTKGWRRYR